MAKSKIYPHSGAYAQEHDELKQYFASFNALKDCKEAIEQAIAGHYHDNRLNTGGAREVIAQFGLERTMYVLAATVQAKNHDGRIDQDNKVWARTFPLVVDMDTHGRNRTMELQLYRAHPGLIDLFVHEARDEASISCPVYRGTYDQAKEAGELAAYRTSFRVSELCQREIEQTITESWDGMHVAPMPSGKCWSGLARSVFPMCWRTPSSRKIGMNAFPALTCRGPRRSLCTFPRRNALSAS